MAPPLLRRVPGQAGGGVIVASAPAARGARPMYAAGTGLLQASSYYASWLLALHSERRRSGGGGGGGAAGKARGR